MPKITLPHDDPYRRRFARHAKWNIDPRVTDDHRLFRFLPEFTGYSRADHVAQAVELCQKGITDLRMAGKLTEKALATYGDHGPLTSGCIRTHFPEPVKDVLRRLCHGSTEAFDRSIAHWQAAGRQCKTWRAMRAGMER